MESGIGAHVNPIFFSETSSLSTKLHRSFEPDTEKIKQRLIRKGVFPTPKILHTIRKKEIQKAIRKSKPSGAESKHETVSESQKQVMVEQSLLQIATREYRTISKEFKVKNGSKTGGHGAVLPVGKPWERGKEFDLRELASFNDEYAGEKLREEHLEELRKNLADRNCEQFGWILDDDLEEKGCGDFNQRKDLSAKQRRVDDEDRVRLLIHRLSITDLCKRDWKFSRLMSQSGIMFTERHLLKIVHGLGDIGNWKHALSVVEWVYKSKDYKHHKSRFVYTKLLAVLGKAKRPSEALQIFNMMRRDYHIYPDMPAYHSIAVTLGQAGLVKELLNIIECLRQKPSKRVINTWRKSWDPRLEPDIVVYNALLNACVPSRHWKGVFWVLVQLRRNNLKPSGATYGLAMEVMLKSGKYDLVHKFFGKMRRSGVATKALTYKVLVRTFWEEGRVNEAVEAVNDMERRGVVGTASVYYELACCLCNSGRWQEALVQAEKMKKLTLTRPVEVAFTGMIQSAMDGGHIRDCLSIFEHMKEYCTPNIGTINAMLKAYGRNDMFMKAKQIFEATKMSKSSSETNPDGCTSLTLDLHSYSSMLEASASSLQWEYFEYVYKEMTLSGYQLDQKKHAWLLVEASKAGKWHLLEHAFDTILEAGEIPHLLLFTEMICQNVVRHDYQRVATLVNGMAHVSLQVSEKQWTDLFLRSRDMIGKEELQNLLTVLRNSGILTETTVSNLLKSLNSICGSTMSTDSCRQVPICIEQPDLNDGRKFLPGVEDAGDVAVDMLIYARNEQDSVADVEGNLLDDGDDVAFDDLYVHLSDNDDIDVDLVSNLSISYANDRDRNSGICGCSDNVEAASDLSTGCVDDRGDSSLGSGLPSASEILEMWRESRKKDGIFFPFQL